MPFKKNNKAAKGKGAIQTGKRPCPKYYFVYGIRFRQEDDIGRKFKAFLKEEDWTVREFVTLSMRYDKYLRHNMRLYAKTND